MLQPSHVVSEVLNPDLGLRTHDAAGAHQRPSHVVGLRAEEMFDPGAHGGLGPVAGLALFAQRFAAFAFPVDAALPAPSTQLSFHIFGAKGQIGPDVCTGVALYQQVINPLAVMQDRVADMVTAHQLMLAVHVHMALVAVVGFPVFLGPTSNGFFLVSRHA